MLMEMSSPVKWNSQQVEEECDFNGSIPFDTLDDFTNEQYVLSMQQANFEKSLSSESYDATFFTTNHQENKNNHYTSHHENICDSSFERPAKQSKMNTWKASPVRQGSVIMSSSSSSQIISFGNVSTQTMDQSCGFVKDELVVLPYEGLNHKLLDSNASFDNENYTTIAGHGIKRSVAATCTKAPTHAHDHVIAERKRRERLTERFIALSAIVPGLKKLDKASVLGDAIKYLKQLRERVDLLEEQIKKKKCEETSVVSRINDSSKLPSASEDSSSCDDNSGGYSNKTVAEIEARVLEKNVLIRIHCEKQKGIIPKILTEIDKLHLTVVSSNVLPFGDHAMDVTIISQMEAEFSSTVDGLVRKLTSSLQ